MNHSTLTLVAALSMLSMHSSISFAEEGAVPPSTSNAAPKEATTSLKEIVVSSRRDDLVGVADSSNQGTVGAKELAERTYARPGEILETVPGLIITQHTGGGKANQYYLRGFNLDHGTDFATYLDGVPLNLTTHAHGQGYTDLNWLIPELVKGVSYKKGVYYADQGDFANAGSAEIQYFDQLPQSIASVEGGSFGYARALAAGSSAVAKGHVLYALEAQHSDGPWEAPMDYRRINGLAKYSVGDELRGYSFAFQSYSGIWNGSDQIPSNLIASGDSARYAVLDPSTGGVTSRSSLYGDWHHKDSDSATQVIAYLVKYRLDLYSNFTYFLDQTNGDQIEQNDSRIYGGVRAQHTMYGKLCEHEMENSVGLQARQDTVDVSLNHSKNRELVDHVRNDKASVLNVALWGENKTQWSSWFRSVEGLRGDLFNFHSDSDTSANSGSAPAGVLSPKLSLIFGPWTKTETYVQGGFGFRSGDARGVLSTVNPEDSSKVSQAPGISRTRGAEIGVRTSAVENLNSTLSFWNLWSDSDIAFAGDSGSVEDTGRPGHRYGIEWTNFYTLAPSLTLDADFSYSWAKYTDGDPNHVGDRIPESMTSVIAAGLTAQNVAGLEGAFASLRLRYFGPRPLVEDGSEQSASSTVFNFMAGYECLKSWVASIEVLNLLDAKYNDNEYYYSYRLKGQTAGPEADGGYLDHMVHPGEPRSFRMKLSAHF
jgi:hypothetical protein